MLSVQTRPKYIRKNVQLPNGSWALVVFELVQVNGKITAKAVYGEILGQSRCDGRGSDQSVGEKRILALPVYFERQAIKPVVSPFFAEIKTLIRDFAFVISQPTRAPGF